jgi:formylglycine-generating enzyme required for sulfatase activity
MIESQVRSLGLADCRTAWFTAWKYQGREQLSQGLMLTALASLYPQAGSQPLDTGQDPKQQQLIEQLDRLSAAVTADVEWNEGTRWRVNVGHAMAVPLGLAARLVGLGDIAKDLGIDPNLANILRREVTVQRMEQIRDIEQFEDRFTAALRETLGPSGRLIVFLDDLDRCLPEQTVSVLETIKLFLNVPGTVFVLAMGRELVRSGIEAHYLSALSSSVERGGILPPITGDQYLQKVIQLPFHLPPLDEEGVGHYIDQLNAGTDEDRIPDEVRQVLSKGVFRNPRQVKLSINMFRLMKRIAEECEERGGVEEGTFAWPLVAKTVLIQAQWPELYRTWSQYPTIVQTLEQQYDAHRDNRTAGLGDVGMAPVNGDAEPGLLRQYVVDTERYALLADLMTFSTVGTGRSRARFTGLRHREVRAYLGLTGDPLGPPHLAESRQALLREMLSGDEVRIREAVVQVKEYADDTTLRDEITSQTLAVLRAAAQTTSVRSSAGIALDMLGDSRFRTDRFHMLDDAMWGLIEVAAGEFTMGSIPARDGDATELEQPSTVLVLPTFFIGRFPVTSDQFEAFLSATDYTPSDPLCVSGPGNAPVTHVSWYDAVAYCDWLHAELRNADEAPGLLRDGLRSRRLRVTLPSEAEWEKAARGSDARVYPWGDTFDAERTNCAESGLGKRSSVGCFPGGRSPYGAEDMSGNVWEWTRSRYASYPYPDTEAEQEEREDLAAGPDEFRTGRGGSYDRARSMVRSTSRVKDVPNGSFPYYGFRIAVCSTPERTSGGTS